MGAAKRAREGTTPSAEGLSRHDLVDAVLADLPAAYVRIGKPDRFVSFAKTFAGDRLPAIVETLGRAYELNGMLAESESLCASWRAHHDDGCAWR